MADNQKMQDMEKSFDEIIKMSTQMEMNSVLEQAEQALEDAPPVPDDMFDRIMRACKQQEAPAAPPQKKPAKKKWSVVTKVAIVAAILLTILIGSLSIDAVRGYVFKLFNRNAGDNVQFLVTDDVEKVQSETKTDESDIYNAASDVLGVDVLEPTTLPNGFTLSGTKFYENDHVKMNYQNGNAIIKFTQTIMTGQTDVGTSVDTKDDKTFEIEIDGNCVPVSAHQQMETQDVWYTAVWNDEVLVYSVIGNCSKQDFMQFITGLQ